MHSDCTGMVQKEITVMIEFHYSFFKIKKTLFRELLAYGAADASRTRE